MNAHPQHDVVFFDLDGVIYTGPMPVAYAAESIAQLRAAGVRCCFITNNASRTPDDVAEHLQQLGIPCDPDDVVTSAQAGVHLLRERIAPGSVVLVVGGDGLRTLVAQAGFTPVTRADQGPIAVIQGFGPDVSWRDLAEACFAIHAGAMWIATNPDTTFPTDRGVAPGNGALVGVVREVVGRPPDAVAGKPEPALLHEAMRRTGARSPILVGDRLDTDVAAGKRVGIPTVLVLTGISGRAEAERGPLIPDAIIDDLRGLVEIAVGRLPAGGSHAR